MTIINSLLLLLPLLLWCGATSHIGEDGKCPLQIFVPFTLKGATNLAFKQNDWKMTNNGFSQLAAAVLAARHFNQRNASVIPELENYSNCPVLFDLESTHVYNSDGKSHDASRAFFVTATGGVIPGRELPNLPPIPCAIVGPFSDFPARELSVMAQAARVPMITARSYNVRLVADDYSPFTSSVFPDLGMSAGVMVNWLFHRNRTNFIAFLHPMTDEGFQRREAMGINFDLMNMTYISSSYVDGASGRKGGGERTHEAAVKRVKDSGYRTVVIALDDPFENLEPIANAMDALGMLDGGYFFVFLDIMEPNIIYDTSSESVRKLLVGAAWLVPFSEDFFDPNTPFLKSWLDQGKETVDMINRLNPMTSNQKGHVFAEPDYYQKVPPEFGSAYMYDAVMAIGIGACEGMALLDNATNGTLAGDQHNSGVRLSKFHGASGYVAFGASDFFLGGARSNGTSFWGAVNFLHPDQGWFQVTDRMFPGEEPGWYKVEDVPFIYVGNTTKAPEPLRDTPEQNYLNNSLRIIGFTCMAIAVFIALGSAGWVFICRKHRVVTASQPFFLYIICFGAIVQASTIFSISFDESQGWSEKQLSRACMSLPWLLTLGHTIVYSALFTKTWRIQRVLSFERRKVEILHVVAPMVALLASATIILVLWTALEPVYWHRSELNKTTGESIGMCNSKNMVAWLLPLVTVMMIPTLLTGWLAYQTRDVDDAYTESWWIFVLILVQTEVVIVSAPVIAILREESTDGRYLGFTFLLWAFPMSTLSLIMVPKMMAYSRAVRGVKVQQTKRGKHEGTRISGLTVPHSSSSPTNWTYDSDSSKASNQQKQSDASRDSNMNRRSDTTNFDNDGCMRISGLPSIVEGENASSNFANECSNSGVAYVVSQDDNEAAPSAFFREAMDHEIPAGHSDSTAEIYVDIDIAKK